MGWREVGCWCRVVRSRDGEGLGVEWRAGEQNVFLGTGITAFLYPTFLILFSLLQIDFRRGVGGPRIPYPSSSVFKRGLIYGFFEKQYVAILFSSVGPVKYQIYSEQ